MKKQNEIQKYIRKAVIDAGTTVQQLSMAVCGSRTSFWERSKEPGRFRIEEIVRMFWFLKFPRAQQDEFMELLRKEVAP